MGVVLDFSSGGWEVAIGHVIHGSVGEDAEQKVCCKGCNFLWLWLVGITIVLPCFPLLATWLRLQPRRGLELLLLLCAWKLAAPRSVFLLRGNHESTYCSWVYGFRREVRCKRVWAGERVFFLPAAQVQLVVVLSMLLLCPW